MLAGWKGTGSLKGNRRTLRRARSWRWEPPGIDATVADEHAQQRWAEARTKAITWAMGVMDDPRVIYLDTETTGFGPRAEIVDIAVVSAAGEVVLESLVQPTRRIPADATAIHGITNADVKDAPAWCDLYEDLLRVLAGRRIIVYNVIFDRQMVNQACDRYDLAAPAADWECAMRKYAGFYGNWDSGKRWYRFQKLERAVLAFGAEPGGHRAAADAFACRAVVLGMAATPPPMPATGANMAPPSTPNGHGMFPPNKTPQSPATTVERRRRSPRSPQQQPVDAYTRWARAVLEFVALLDAIPAELRERPGACGAWSVREARCALRRLGMGSRPPAAPHRRRSDASRRGLQGRWIQCGKRRRTCSAGLVEDAGRAGQGEQYARQGGPRHAGRCSHPGVAIRARGRFRGARRRAPALDRRDRDSRSRWPGADDEIGARPARSALKSVTAWHRMDVLVRIPTTRLAPRLAVRLPLPSPDRQRFCPGIPSTSIGVESVPDRYGISPVAEGIAGPSSTSSPSGQTCGPW